MLQKYLVFAGFKLKSNVHNSVKPCLNGYHII